MTRQELGDIVVQHSFGLRVHASKLKEFLDVLTETTCNMKWVAAQNPLGEMHQRDYELYERFEAGQVDPCLVFYSDGDVAIASADIVKKIEYPLFDLENYYEQFFQQTTVQVQAIPENMLEGLLQL